VKCCSLRYKKVNPSDVGKRGAPIWDIAYKPKLLKPWPDLQLAAENIEPGDHMGTYHAKQYIAKRCGSSAANAVDS
jgi:hypothetical protein